MGGLTNYSLSDVSLHTSKNDCWLIIHGKVYDVSAFLDDHPGGDHVLLRTADLVAEACPPCLIFLFFKANGDATQSFEDVGHSSAATSMMAGYLIGTVDGTVDGAVTAAGEASPTDPLLAKSAKEKALPTTTTTPSKNFVDVLLPLLTLASAFAAWYYLTFHAAKA
ncbi:Cytochrome B5 isoform D [Apostasia shenzhenica]|uniref:Cytochrome B5 isoform D n=1 Tax=Apostasia shenzhenica TaxID=1088818 RepID=A0A2I0AK59_9ASPA|nr:Cytochrome B5 isoform D [Apostasia shenzhenica]